MPTRVHHRRALLIEDLRRAIDCLPVQTRVAMLEGVGSNEIIVGAYVDRSGGVCPMLAAHRCGGRTDFLTFARTWDRFTGARGRARRATERELRILTAHLESSLMADPSTDFERAIADHRALVAARADERAKPAAQPPGEPDRRRELRRRDGWAWMRVFRRLDEYERALARVEAERDCRRAESAAGTESERDHSLV
jgi:hypothetical protein